jgi:hypothetical protein
LFWTVTVDPAFTDGGTLNAKSLIVMAALPEPVLALLLLLHAARPRAAATQRIVAKMIDRCIPGRTSGRLNRFTT